MKPVQWNLVAALFGVVGTFCLLIAFLYIQAGDLGGAIILAIPAQVGWTLGCIILFVQRRFP
jgi:hypothetical protein